MNVKCKYEDYTPTSLLPYYDNLQNGYYLVIPIDKVGFTW